MSEKPKRHILIEITEAEDIDNLDIEVTHIHVETAEARYILVIDPALALFIVRNALENYYRYQRELLKESKEWCLPQELDLALTLLEERLNALHEAKLEK